MAIIRHLEKNEDALKYIGSIGLFCAILCSIIMIRFRRFKASINFNSGKSSAIEQYDISAGISLNGAYRINRDELFGSDLYPESPKKITPSMVKLPTKQSEGHNNQSISTNNLAKPSSDQTNKSTEDVPQTVNQSTKINLKEQKKLEKQRFAEQKKQEKLVEKERQREEKLRKEREKLIVQQTRSVQQRPKREAQTKIKKRAAPQPQQNKTPETVTTSKSSQRQQYSTNTLQSSISKTSGPPPYSAVPELTPTRSDATGNTSLAKPVEDMDSWGLISQHRQQMNRQTGVSKSVPKQRHLDLHYEVGRSRDNENENSVA